MLPLALALALALSAPALCEPPAPDDAALVHVLNRLAYGPRPSDLAAIRRSGVQAWIEAQLHPERIADEAVTPRLARLDTDAFIDGMLSGDDGGRRVVEGMQAAKLIRAVYSERQLEEVLVDFWMNHFNVFAGKGPVKFMLTRVRGDVVRPARVGPLRGSAESDRREPRDAVLPRQLALHPTRRRGRGRRGGSRRRAARGRRAGPQRGLNENYARELMELHTLGVDAGYTQKDVTEVARCFTGWTITRPARGRPALRVPARLHDARRQDGARATHKGGRPGEGEQVLHLLAAHPATARHIATSWRAGSSRTSRPRRWSSAPRRGSSAPAATSARWCATIVSSPEFLAPRPRGAKVKTPLEFVASAVRAAGAEVQDARGAGPPLGRDGHAALPARSLRPATRTRRTPGSRRAACVARLNFALDLAAGRVRGVRVEPPARITAVSASCASPAGLSDATTQGAPSSGCRGLDPRAWPA